MTRQEQKEARREQVLNTGLDLFVRNGYYGTTTKNIAETLGISQGLMFHYFKSKDELYMELLTELGEGTFNVFNFSELTQMNPLEIFEKMLVAIIESFHKHPRSAKYFILVAQTRICTRLTDEIREKIKKLDTNIFEKLITAGQASGIIRDGDPKSMAGLVFSIIQGIAQTYVCLPDIPLPNPIWIVDMLRK